MTQALSADEIIRLLGLQPHPEGGHFCETFRDASGPEARARSTAIYFLLKAGERSHWHRVDAAEVWHFYAGAPLVLRIANDGEPIETIRLGTGLTEGERPQAVVPADAWQSAESLGEWTLVGCTVAPGFQFEGFELARPGWEPRAVRNALHEPVIEIAIEPKSEADRQTVAAALSRLALEDAFIRLKIDQESGRTILAGSSEHHLDSVITRLEGEFGLDVTLGAPQVAYRETIRRAYEQDYTHKKQTGGTGQFARVKLAIEPNEAGAGFEFENKVIGGSVPKEYVPGVEKGLNSVMGAGPLAGFPVVDVKVQLIDGAYHEVDSSALAFEIAARHAFREGLQKASPVLLEPIMKVEVVSPEEYVGSVIGDLNARRGQIQGQDMRGNATVITAFAPLANMFGYVNNLRPMSQGRASYTMSFSHYAPIPPHPDDGLFPPAIGMRP